ncbi:MAG: Asp/Glu racemase, partial [Alphaproteobacteria bacterium]|nr:Asp/Glu racemase [Alphaproteobacteria bacterium]
IAQMGLAARCAGIRALDLGVADLADSERTTARLLAVASALRDSDGADVLILGCAGMARYRAMLETAAGLPVIDPCRAATAQMLGRIALTDPQQEPSHAR